MVKCSFCGREEAAVMGVHVIFNDGSISYFCSSKCRRNALLLKRDKRKLKWTSAYREERNKAKLQEEKAKAAKAAVSVRESDQAGATASNAKKKSAKQMKV